MMMLFDAGSCEIRRWNITFGSIAFVLTMPHTCIVPDEPRARLLECLASLQANITSAGKRLRDYLVGIELAALTDSKFLDALLNTKPPQIFVESAVAGDG